MSSSVCDSNFAAPTATAPAAAPLDPSQTYNKEVSELYIMQRIKA